MNYTTRLRFNWTAKTEKQRQIAARRLLLRAGGRHR
jgi:hypothetical protein